MTEATNFLYPFIDAEERDPTSLIADLARSAQSKIAESIVLRTATLADCAPTVQQAGAEMAERFRAGARLFAFGNGGSSTDAEGAVALFCTPPSGSPLPAMSLVDDRAVLTALANDVGFDLVFSRQLIAHARPQDIAVGFSTSGDSRNVIVAFEEASRRGLLTIGFCGSKGGAMASSEAINHCMVVRSDSVHRIQESQDALVCELWSTVQQHLDEKSTP